MKRVIAFLALMALLAPLSTVMASGNYRSAIDRKWKEVEAWQKKQEEQLRRSQPDASGTFKGLDQGVFPVPVPVPWKHLTDPTTGG